MKQCIKCNAQMSDDAIFCTVCGAKNDAPAQNAQPQFTPQQAQPQFVPPQPQPQFAPQQPQFVPQQPQMKPRTPKPNPAQSPDYTPFQPTKPADNRKLYCILSYISILWLLGMFMTPEKYDSRVRFNVGQGILISILSFGLGLIGGIFTAFNVFVLGGILDLGILSAVLNTFIWIIVGGISIFYMVYGIIKVAQDQDAYLPIIGKLSFYK